jgi:8-oxo-dGTP pyrophosphatase MutT (NUDIX family)
VRTREVFVVVRRGKEYLVVHRSPEQGGYWHGVAGGIEEGESPAEAAERELAEETGLELAPVDLLRSWVYDSVTVHAFAVEAPAGWEPTLDWEHDGYRWCDAAGAAALHHWPEPRELYRQLSGGERAVTPSPDPVRPRGEAG